MSFLSSIFKLSFSNWTAMIGTLIIRVVMARFLGPAGLGTYSIGLNALTISYKVFSMGTVPAAQYHASKYNYKKPEVIWTTIAITCIVSLLAFALIKLTLPFWSSMVFSNQGNSLSIYENFLPFLPVVIIGSALNIMFISYKLVGHYSMLQIIGTTSTPIIFLLLCVYIKPMEAAVFSQQTMWIFAFVFGVCVLWKFMSPIRTSINLGISILKYSLYAWPNMILSIGIGRFAILIAAGFLTSFQIGIYVVALNVIEGIFSVHGSIGQILLSRVGENRERGGELTRQVIRISFILLIAMSLIYIITCYPILIALFGHKFSGSWWISVILLITGISHAQVRIMANYFAGIGRPGLITIALVTEFITLIALIHVLCIRLGAAGMAWSSAIAATVNMITSFCLLIVQMKCPIKDIIVVKRTDIELVKKRVRAVINRRKGE